MTTTLKRGLEVGTLRLLQRIGINLSHIPERDPGKRTVLFRGTCPFHESNARNGFVIFHDGWICDTAKCHKLHGLGDNLLGLLRHFAFAVTNQPLGLGEARRHIERNIEQYKRFVTTRTKQTGRCSTSAEVPTEISYNLGDLQDCLQAPDPYYLSRGYQPETLAHFGVGRCVGPLPDGDERKVGWSIFPVLGPPVLGECPLLGYTARNPRHQSGLKWLHGFQKKAALFNLNNALRSSGPIILCEGPGDVMRFHEAGYPGAVATCGGKLTNEQLMLLLRWHDGHRRIIVAGDNDEVGRQVAEENATMVRKICDTPSVVFPEEKDFGEASVEAIQAILRAATANTSS